MRNSERRRGVGAEDDAPNLLKLLVIYLSRILGGVVRALLLSLLVVWQRVFSPFLGSHCRYYPTCSEYMRQAIEGHGAVVGLVLGIGRLLRCNALFSGGVDMVPKTVSWALVPRRFRTGLEKLG